jgi:hypothetical protein
MITREEDAEKHEEDLFILNNLLETLFFYVDIFDDRFKWVVVFFYIKWLSIIR